ncbi:B3GNT1, Beta-1,3-N-acetylGucosamiNylTransferase 1, homolog [Caenorhabditis elegans]|uniref:B3GNT1, Beta-1,3-N-acetylGucosamiNylTransferase 1, homolog n=1 Tax=Caenorhabditis elegans TaxID=6239 RepID=Q7YWW9_CAEEL|nr:B3GNT1, Beta-1,3-N-acetylGucosamiNylTransferase 1, homolog [Caenorhabditis elegans]CAE17897.1 B3GNT1, Beta-1,3-N-acetylGucosamiNylTransferase 1, homolog [Caenorhabditis elegans]|eukprot:NP_001024774.1 B3GNT1, Beta-1,3-N-acetylGucosamiNylTransferase 1, homolog [Caenorhabditis elegans]
MIRPHARTRFWIFLSIFAICLYIFGFSERNYNLKTIFDKHGKISLENGFIDTEMQNDEYCVGYNFLEATNMFREDGLEPVTLAVHGTSEMMKAIEKKPLNWDGPISFGLFIDFHSRQVLEYISEVHRCDEKFREKVTVHFAFRLSAFQGSCPQIKISPTNRECKEFLHNRDKYRQAAGGPFQLYPSNLMRNIARQGAKSDIHFIADGDMVMSEGFAMKIKPIANQVIDGTSKNLLVVRRFETNETTIPRDHKQLQESIKNKKVFQFHHKFFFSGHKIANISHWFAVSNNTDRITTWEIPYSSSLWEVQVILHRNDLYNADYFPARIKVMQSLVYSLCRANYTFNLLSHVFNVHEGIKLDDTGFSKSVIAHSKKYGKTRAYNRYVKEMDDAYPNTLKKCGNFIM